jgi:hypothetical protein
MDGTHRSLAHTLTHPDACGISAVGERGPGPPADYRAPPQHDLAAQTADPRHSVT